MPGFNPGIDYFSHIAQLLNIFDDLGYSLPTTDKGATVEELPFSDPVKNTNVLV